MGIDGLGVIPGENTNMAYRLSSTFVILALVSFYNYFRLIIRFVH